MESDGQGKSTDEPVSPRVFQIGDFTSLIGQSFPMEIGEEALDLTLAQVEPLPHSVRQGGGFRLEFSGPSKPILPQGTYVFSIGGEQGDIFIVPLGPGPTGNVSYEAIFF